MLTRAYPDKRILMTRDSDVFYELRERTEIANAVPIRRNEAIIYISIHANASSNRNVRGYEVWYLSPDHRRNVLDESEYADSPVLRRIMNSLTEEGITTESTRLGGSILNSFDTVVGRSMPSRGLKAEEWFVVRHSRMPAVLVELGFVTNRDDAVLMTSDTGLNKLTEALYKGIMDFVDEFERSGGFIATR
jgi:N-acetylmuramoyl-L-alanine amidase